MENGSKLDKNYETISNFMIYFFYQYLCESGVEKFLPVFENSQCKFMQKIKVNE